MSDEIPINQVIKFCKFTNQRCHSFQISGAITTGLSIFWKTLQILFHCFEFGLSLDHQRLDTF